MCLAIPMRISEIDGNDAVAEAGTVSKSIRLDLLEDVSVGDFVLIHTGYAIEKVDRDEAIETIELLRKVYDAGKDAGLRRENGEGSD